MRSGAVVRIPNASTFGASELRLDRFGVMIDYSSEGVAKIADLADRSNDHLHQRIRIRSDALAATPATSSRFAASDSSGCGEPAGVGGIAWCMSDISSLLAIEPASSSSALRTVGSPSGRSAMTAPAAAESLAGARRPDKM